MPALEDANDFCTVAAKEMKIILNLGDSASVLVDEELDKSIWLATCDFRTREFQNRKLDVLLDVYTFGIDCKHTFLGGFYPEKCSNQQLLNFIYQIDIF